MSSVAGLIVSNLPLFDLSPDMCIAIAISLLMILICAMATYGAYKVSEWPRFRSSPPPRAGVLNLPNAESFNTVSHAVVIQ